MLKKIKKNNKGFTLVELLVVIAIIGILAVVAVPSLTKNINRAKAADAVAYISAIRTAAISEFAVTQPNAPANADVEGLVDDPSSDVTVGTITVNSNGNLVVPITVSAKVYDDVVKQLGTVSSVTITKGS